MITANGAASPSVAVRDIAVRHGALTILEHASVSLAWNAVTSVTGPSGSGKSTLLFALSGLLLPVSGDRVLSSTISEQDVVYLPQTDTLLPWRTTLANIALGLELRTRTTVPESLIREWATIFNVDNALEKRPHQLSGGMRKRAALARTFCANPRVVLLDEPFNNLDLLDRSNLENFLLRWVRESEKCIALVVHDLEQAISISDSIVTISPQTHGSASATAQIELPAELRSLEPQERREHPLYPRLLARLQRGFSRD